MRPTARELLAVALGATLGTGARLAIDTLIPHSDRDFPLSTLVINVVGSLALGFLVARVWPSAAGWLRAGLGVGLLGSFTTFSAMAVSVMTLGIGWVALLYVASTMVLGLAAAFIGLRLGSQERAPIDEASE